MQVLSTSVELFELFRGGSDGPRFPWPLVITAAGGLELHSEQVTLPDEARTRLGYSAVVTAVIAVPGDSSGPHRFTYTEAFPANHPHEALVDFAARWTQVPNSP